MRQNVAAKAVRVQTYEGAPALARQSAKLELLRAVSSCLLFEDTFYETGGDIADRIAALAQRVGPDFLAELARDVRSRLNLRHVALWLAVQAMRRSDVPDKAGLVADVIQRADELAEIIALYWRQNPAVREVARNDGGVMQKHAPLPAAMKRGIARAFQKFNEYQLAKYDRANAIKLRDALFLSHAKPKDQEQAALWKRLIEGKLATPDTWEVALSAGADKKETFERLLRERKLGYLALLRNLRNMEQAGVDRKLVMDALVAGAPKSRALPFQFVAAWRFAPAFASALDIAMQAALGSAEPLAGSTILVIDVSGSMDAPLSHKSQLNRIDAASALAVLCREVCADVRVFTFSNEVVEVPAVRGLGLVDAIQRSQFHGGTHLAAAVRHIVARAPHVDRLIVITDEQSRDGSVRGLADGRNYLVNVASYQPALDVGHEWVRINGFSERIVDFIRWHETLNDQEEGA
jgi:60 kDa SS-A/Ro ribonucleoprotein